jgi:PAS domain S-box-containing protein
MRANGRYGLLFLLLVLQLLFLFLTFPGGNPSPCLSRIIWALPVLAIIVVLILFSKEQRLESGIAQLLENAERLHLRRSLLPPTDEERLARLDELLHAVSQDISEFQRKEHSVINHALDVICSISQDQTFQSVNPAAVKVWGYSADELIGTRLSDLLVEEDRQKSLQALFGAEKSVDTLSFENRLKRKDGTILQALWSAHWSAADQALFCVAHDITARKLAEKMLEESELRIRQIFEDMPVGLIMANKLGIIEMSNPALAHMCQCKPDELIGRHIQTVLPDSIKSTAPPDYEQLFGSLTDTRVFSSSGRVIPVNVTTRGLTVGAERKYLLVLIDTTEREKLEQLKSEFFAMVNHDLRSPLTSLASVLDRFSSGVLGELNARGKEVIAKNLGEIERLIKLVDELLDIEKMKSGKFVIEAEPNQVDAIVESSISALEDFAQRRKVEIQYKKSDLQVTADSSLLIRVLINLISNAVKFSAPAARVSIAVQQDGAELVFSVKDSGRGVPEEFRQSIFEPYEQVEQADQRVKGGTGLGLPICKLIVEQHGGRIWVESGADRGSIFNFTIPVSEPVY